MDANKKQAIMEAKTFDDLLNAEYGKVGTPARDQYEDDAQAFCLAECLKAERKRAGLTQEPFYSLPYFQRIRQKGVCIYLIAHQTARLSNTPPASFQTAFGSTLRNKTDC